MQKPVTNMVMDIKVTYSYRTFDTVCATDVLLIETTGIDFSVTFQNKSFKVPFCRLMCFSAFFFLCQHTFSSMSSVYRHLTTSCWGFVKRPSQKSWISAAHCGIHQSNDYFLRESRSFILIFNELTWNWFLFLHPAGELDSFCWIMFLSSLFWESVLLKVRICSSFQYCDSQKNTK